MPRNSHPDAVPVVTQEGRRNDPEIALATTAGYVVRALDTPWQPAQTPIAERRVFFIRCTDPAQVLQPGQHVEFVNRRTRQYLGLWEVLAPNDAMFRGRHPTWERPASTAPAQNFTIRLDPDQRTDLERIAGRLDRDLSYVIRKAIDEYIGRHQNDSNGQ